MNTANTLQDEAVTLTLQQVQIHLQENLLVSVDRTIAAGEIFTVMGPSGSGKSSLLAYIAGFLDPVFRASGRIRVGDMDVTRLPAEQRRIGLLFQDPLLFPHLSVAGNLRFALPQTEANKEQTIHDNLCKVGLDGFAERDPATLSGGQQSRVALLRLLLSRPRAVLLDEPFNKLDADLRREFREQVFGQLRQSGLPTILVTHDREDAEAAGGEVLAL